jgi:hypothetical protein
MELKWGAGAGLTAGGGLKCFVFHHVPTEIVFTPGFASS